ncbi:MAG: hypothetical protein E6987_01365 [Peptoniphilus harei]|nr:hypothetical protein [Peptoniphilus harei]
MEDLKFNYLELHTNIKEYCDKKDLEFDWKNSSFPIIARIYYKKKLHYLFLQVYFESKEGGPYELGKRSN